MKKSLIILGVVLFVIIGIAQNITVRSETQVNNKMYGIDSQEYTVQINYNCFNQVVSEKIIK